MIITKTNFMNWSRCPLFLPLDLKYNGKSDPEKDYENEKLKEIAESVSEQSEGKDDDNEFVFEKKDSSELSALMEYYRRVEEEALRTAKKYFHGKFTADSRDVHKQKFFKFAHGDNEYCCYVDIYAKMTTEST